MSRASIRVATLAVLAALVLVCLLRLQVTTSIAQFLPSGREARLADLSRHLAESQLARSMVLRISGPGAREAAQALADALRARGEIDWIQAGEAAPMPDDLVAAYFEHRLFLVSEQPETQIPRLFAPDELARRAATLRARLAGPASPIFARIAPRDPLGLHAEILERLRAEGSSLVATPQARPESGDVAFVYLRTRASPFSGAEQAPLLAAIDEAFARIDAQAGGDLVLEQSGVNRLALASERSIRRDVNFISVVSLIGVAALFLLVFRSLSSLLLALLPTLGGVLVAASVAALGFSPLHGITLGFGLALVGVSIDYPIHVLNHRALQADPRDGSLRGSLLAGGLTTAAGFGVLAFSNFPGVGAMGLFAATGIVAALGITLFCVPAFLPADGRLEASRFQRAAALWLEGFVHRLGERRRLAAAIPIVFALVAVAGLPRLHWEDDPAALSSVDPVLLAEHDRVNQSALGLETGRFVVGLAADREAALRLDDEIYTRLQRAVAAGQLDGIRSLHPFLWSEALQRRNLAAFQSIPDVDARIDAAFAEAGFRPGVFRDFARDITAPPAAPLRPQDFAGSALERLVDATLVPMGEGWAAITYLRNVRNAEAIEAALGDLEGAHYFDQKAVLHEIYAAYRRSTIRLVGLGGVLVLAVLWLRYRSLRRALLAFLPCALVALTTLGVFGLLGQPVNLPGVVSLVLIMGMGVDYGVFVMDSARDPSRLAPTLLSLVVSCLTTLFVFGTLALSQHVALRSMGLTIGVGIGLALLISPSVLVLSRRESA